MKIVLFYSSNLRAAWSLGEGLTRTLARMGHEVTPAPIPAGESLDKRGYEEVAARMPKQYELTQADAIIVSGPEHLFPWLNTFYPMWHRVKTPKLGWYHETFDRKDIAPTWERAKKISDFHFFPSIYDAEEKAGTHLPFGVDTDIFRADLGLARIHELAFIGLVYPKRREFLHFVGQACGDFFKNHQITIGQVSVQDLSGVKPLETARLYAHNLAQIKIFVNLPTMSSLLVTKVYEVIACGALLINPFSEQARRNWEATSLPGIQGYKENSPEDFVRVVKESLANWEQVSEWAQAATHNVHANHNLEKRLDVMLGRVQ